MNLATAAHLNMLRALSAPIVLTIDAEKNKFDLEFNDNYSYKFKDEKDRNIVKMKDIIRNILTRHFDVSLATEIARAAHEDREACGYMPDADHSLVFWLCNNNRAGRIAVELARAEIDAAIAADNAIRQSRYQTYRTMCESGVAVPPA